MVCSIRRFMAIYDPFGLRPVDELPCGFFFREMTINAITDNVDKPVALREIPTVGTGGEAEQ